MSDLWNPKPKTPEEEKALNALLNGVTIVSLEVMQQYLQRFRARSIIESYDKGFDNGNDLWKQKLDNPYIEIYHLILQIKNVSEYCKANQIPFDSETFIYKHTLTVFQFPDLEVEYFKNYKKAQLTIDEEIKHLTRHLSRLKKWCDTELREAAIQELIDKKWKQIIK